MSYVHQHRSVILDLPPIYLAHIPLSVLARRRSPKRRCKSLVLFSTP